MRLRIVVLSLAVALVMPAASRATPVASVVHEDVTASIGPSAVTLSNGIVERTWRADSLLTTSAGRVGRPFTASHSDFALLLDGVRIESAALPVVNVEPYDVTGGEGIRWTLGAIAGVQATRTVEVYDGIAGFKSQTTINSLAPVVVSGYTLDEVAARDPVAPLDATAKVQAFRAGADWRYDNWNPLSIGDPHKGQWREETGQSDDESTSDDLTDVSAPGEWLSIEGVDGRRVAMVSERRDYASSRMTYEGTDTGVARADVDLSRDIVYIGPFEETGHIENPTPAPARHRVLSPGTPVSLEPAFTIFGADADDDAWQFYKYLTQHRNGSYPKRVMFNSDGVDNNAISTGAKDDMSYSRFLQILHAVRDMHIDTFIFDDGWMAASGDWCADSPSCPEPRRKFPPRFPDDHFAAVRAALAGEDGPADDIALGLWMNPMEFNPASKAFSTNPQWACAPVGDALAVDNAAEPDSSSNEAGIGVWNPLAMGVDPDDPSKPMRMIDYMKGRILRAIESYGATYFKFDFLAWVDCGGVFPVTMYEYHDAFVEMLDAVRLQHPEVTFSIDETNDYRMFPFESTARGPAWFQNGGPDNAKLLHNVWNLSPYVPGYSLGQRSFGQAGERDANIDTALASSLLGHITFSMPVDTQLLPAQRAETAKWVDFYHANSATLAGMTYPLLEDPLLKRWTGLQVWNGDDASGWLLAFRQSGTESVKSVALRGLDGVPDDATFRVERVDPASGASVLATETAATLRSGLAVTIGAANGYAIFRITPES
ncbi:MAG: hypothetical protein ABR548_15320 [Actinomycetota bacterium]|nr:hypothetical protein [Actinomycetota bacterium]